MLASRTSLLGPARGPASDSTRCCQPWGVLATVRSGMTDVVLARHLLRAKDLVDARYFEPLVVGDMAAAAHLSAAYFSREFRRTFGESPHQYLLTRRLERAASLLRTTDRPVSEICFTVGLRSLGSFTTSFHRVFGLRGRADR